MNNWKLYLDDIRPCPDGWKAARSVAEAIALINLYGWPVEMSLDHDMGFLEGSMFEEAPTGYDFCLWVLGRAQMNSLPPCAYKTHSSNPAGVEKMRRVLSKLISPA